MIGHTLQPHEVDQESAEAVGSSPARVSMGPSSEGLMNSVQGGPRLARHHQEHTWS